MTKSSHAHGLTAGVVAAASTLALVAVFLAAWDEPAERKNSIEKTGLYVAIALLVAIPLLNTAYIVAKKRLR